MAGAKKKLKTAVKVAQDAADRAERAARRARKDRERAEAAVQLKLDAATPSATGDSDRLTTEDATREQLLERARAAEIPNRSRMNKADLVAALRSRETTAHDSA